MAIWNFRFSLVPRLSIIEKYESIPKVLPEYKANYTLPIPDFDLEVVDFWKDYNIDALFNLVKGNLSELKSYGDVSVYGFNNGSKIELSESEISVKFDARKPDYNFLKFVINMAKDFDCLIVIEGSGKVVAPDYMLISDFFHDSRAYRFCQNPDDVMLEIKNSKV